MPGVGRGLPHGLCHLTTKWPADEPTAMLHKVRPIVIAAVDRLQREKSDILS